MRIKLALNADLATIWFTIETAQAVCAARNVPGNGFTFSPVLREDGYAVLVRDDDGFEFGWL